MGDQGQTEPESLRDVIRSCRRRRTAVKLAGPTGVELSGIKTLWAALALDIGVAYQPNPLQVAQGSS